MEELFIDKDDYNYSKKEDLKNIIEILEIESECMQDRIEELYMEIDDLDDDN